MNMLNGKKLLVLGGTYASYDVVKTAQSMGVYVIVTDNLPLGQGSAKRIADEVWSVSTNDFDELEKLICKNGIDGIFCGPSEFNVKNMILLCARCGLPCYATPEQWETSSNKGTFKEYCKKFDIPTAPEYSYEMFLKDDGDREVSYPVIVKPVDSNSSRGIAVCENKSEVLRAYNKAMNASVCKKVVIEKYIDNGGKLFSFRYILDEGSYYPYLTFDTYVVDPEKKERLISAFTYFPSKQTKFFLQELDPKIQEMFHDMGLENGVAFVQSIPYDGEIYCHEMGYRLSGGMLYKITEPVMGINDMEMMIRYALGEKMVYPEEIQRINLHKDNFVMAQLMIPLECGIIKSVEGLDDILKMKNVVDFLQYYDEGDEITPEVIGTLGQHFGRFTLQAENQEEMIQLVDEIQRLLKIKNVKNEEMYVMRFDVNRLLVNNNENTVGGGINSNQFTLYYAVITDKEVAA